MQQRSTGLRSGPGRWALAVFLMLMVLMASLAMGGGIAVADAAEPLEISTAKLPHAVASTPYRHFLAARGGAPAYAWSITNGVLPGGISLDAATGELSGTAAVTTTSPLSIQVTDAAGGVASASLDLTVDPKPIFEEWRQPAASVQIPYAQGYGFTVYGTTLTKFDANGVQLWSKNYASSYTQFYGVHTDYAHSLVYVSTGSTIVKLDLEGNILGSFAVATGHGGYIQKIVAAADGSLYLGVNSLSDMYSTTLIMKVDASGTVLWSKLKTKKSSMNSTGPAYTDGLVLDSNGNLFVAGTTWWYWQEYTWLFKYAPDGTELLDTNLSGAFEAVKSFAIDGNDTLYIAGTYHDPMGSQNVYRLRILNGTGVTLWSEPGSYYDPNPFTSADEVRSTDDGFYVRMSQVTSPYWVKYRLNFHIKETTLPQADLGVGYAQTLSALGGKAPYDWSVVSGILPDGLHLDPVSGAINGSPTTTGSYPLLFQATGADGAMALKSLPILVAGPPSITTTTIPDMAVSNSYNIPVATTGGHPWFIWSIASGELPPGIFVTGNSVDTVWLGGSPTAPGTYTFTLQLTDAIGATASQTFSVKVYPSFTITTSSLPEGLTNQSYTAQLQVAGGTAPITWSLVSGTLPAGLSFDPATGVISGTPTTAGSVSLTFSATDAAGATVTSGAMQLVVYEPLSIYWTYLPDVKANSSYAGFVRVINGKYPYTYTITQGVLPSGITMDAAGNFSGTTTALGSYPFTLVITDGLTTLTNNYVLNVLYTPPTFMASSLQAITGTSVSQSLAAQSGIPPLTYELTSGTLPAGLSFDPVTAVVSGAPQETGVYPFTVTVVDSQGTSVAQNITYTVYPGNFSKVWQRNFARYTVNSVAADTNGNYAITGNSGTSKFTAAGAVSWTQSAAVDVAADASGNTLVVRTVNGNIDVTKYSTTGAPLWQKTYDSGSTDTATSVSVDAAGTVAVSGYYGSTMAIIVYDANGTQLWAVQLTDNYPQYARVRIVDGQVYMTSVYKLKKYDAAGNLLWSKDVTALRTATADAAGNIYAGGSPSGASAPSVKKFSPTGALLWEKTLPWGNYGTVDDIAVAGDGTVYASAEARVGTGIYADTFMVAALDADGTHLGTFTYSDASYVDKWVRLSLSDNNSILVSGTTRGSNSDMLFKFQLGLMLSTDALAPGQTGTAYSAFLKAAGGAAPYTWSLAGGSLPTGLTLNSVTGEINGVPTDGGVATFTVQVRDKNGASVTKSYTLSITRSVAIAGTILADGVTGTAYSAGFTTDGGVAPFVWSLASGSLPAGLTFNASGAISGTPTTAGVATFTVKVTDANNTSATAEFTLTVVDPLVVTTASLPAGTMAVPFSQTLTATGGTAPYSWNIGEGTLPEGLGLDGTTGVISGTPTNAGVTPVTFQVSDSRGVTATRVLAISVASNLAVTTQTVAGATTGIPVSQALAASGGTGAYVWSVAGGALPAGLNLSTTGVVSGTPTTAGTFTFTVKVTDASGSVATRSLTMTVASNLTVTTTAAPGGVAGTAYSLTLAAAGGSGAYSWSIYAGVLPAGLSLAGNGVISGIPTGTGTSNITVQVVDAGGNTAVGNLSITVIAAPLVIGTTSLPGGFATVIYSQTLTAEGGIAPYTWSRTAGTLPAGLTLSASGVLSGTPTTAGTYTFTVRVTDSAAVTATKSFTVTIASSPKTLSVTTTSLSGATVGTAYSKVLAATGGLTPYTWSIGSGSLPAGLALDPATGTISGVPTAAGTSTFTVKVTDIRNVSATRSLSLAVTASLPDLVVTTVSGPTSITRGSTKYTFTATVKNQGTASAGASTVSFYLSTDTAIATSDILVGNVSVGALSVGTSQTVTLTVAVPTSVTARSYYIGALADSSAVVAESSETNNSKAASKKTTVK